uniref:Uncharacterized protein n=1 Tax=Globisporangium ultimum (strain ATCC 200006 / CBS 805.95 / DAOM BR144) TaxID=431595 RepID=K3WHS1_GLOUD
DERIFLGGVLDFLVELLNVLLHTLEQRLAQLVLLLELSLLVIQFLLELGATTADFVHKLIAFIDFGIATFLRNALVAFVHRLEFFFTDLHVGFQTSNVLGGDQTFITSLLQGVLAVLLVFIEQLAVLLALFGKSSTLEQQHTLRLRLASKLVRKDVRALLATKQAGVVFVKTSKGLLLAISLSHTPFGFVLVVKSGVAGTALRDATTTRSDLVLQVEQVRFDRLHLLLAGFGFQTN